jgi:hypothetical protein
MNVGETEKSGISDAGVDDSIAQPKQSCCKRSRRNLTLLMLALTMVTAVAAFFSKHGPQSAVASPVANASRESRPHDAAGNRTDQPADATSDIVTKLRFAPAEVQVPLADLKADPFGTGGGSGRPVQLPDDAVESQRREQERQAALEAVQSLQLQAILRDDSHRTCTINGVLYQEGQEVDGFTVEEIATTTVVVRKGVYRFELRVR